MAVLLLLGVGVMSVLYVTKTSELDKTEKQLASQIAERDATIGANKTEIEQLQGDLQSMKDKHKELEQNLTGTKSDRDEQARAEAGHRQLPDQAEQRARRRGRRRPGRVQPGDEGPGQDLRRGGQVPLIHR